MALEGVAGDLEINGGGSESNAVEDIATTKRSMDGHTDSNPDRPTTSDQDVP